MISGMGALPDFFRDVEGGLEDGAHLHFVDLGIGDAEAAAAVAEHRVDLVQFGARGLRKSLRRHAGLLRDAGDVFGRVRQEFVQRRIEQADRHRQAGHDAEDLGEVGALHRQQLVERAAAALLRSSARIISRTTGMRSASKNMCSVRQRPMPSAPNLRAVSASSGVSALARTFMRRTASAQPISSAKSPPSGGSTIFTAPTQHLALGAVDGDDVALLQDARADADRAAFGVDLQRAGAAHARTAHAARDDGGVRGHAAARRDDGLGGVHALDVFGAGLDADEDDGHALGRERYRVGRLEHDLADGGAGRGRQALDEDIAHGVVGDGGMQQLVELRRVEAQHGFLLGDQAFAAHVDGELAARPARCACRCGSAACRACPARP